MHQFSYNLKGPHQLGKLLEQYQAQLLHSHTCMETFIKEYEQVNRCPLPTNTRLRLQLGFFSWSLVRWLRELALSVPAMRMSSCEALDVHLLESISTLAKAFINMWGVNHTTHCRQPDSCMCWMLDGHMKCKRPVCANKFARAFDCGRLGTAVLGCTHSPMMGSKFCTACREAGARSAVELQGAQVSRLWEQMQEGSVEAAHELVGAADANRTAPVRRSARLAEVGLAHLASEIEIDAQEETVYLVESILDSRRWTNLVVHHATAAATTAAVAIICLMLCCAGAPLAVLARHTGFALGGNTTNIL